MSSLEKKGLALILCALIAAGAAGVGRPAMAEAVLAGEFEGHEYLIVTDVLSWKDARAACEAEGGYLAVITSQEEFDYVMTLVPNDYPKLWIGGTDEAAEGEWRWVTGEGFAFTAWGSGEPNNHENEDYLQIGETRKWNDGSQWELCQYLCEYSHEEAEEGEPASGFRTLRVGMRGRDVARLRERMQELKYMKFSVADNLYSALFARQIREFQQENGLAATGVATPALQELIFSDKAIPNAGE